MAEILEFPFDSGAYEAADREWLPPNLLERVENMRLDLDGRLGVRPGNTALAMTTYSSNTLVAYDLANYAGRLVALGDQCSVSRPTDLFEFVNAVRAWRGTSQEDGTFGTGPRLPRVTKVREVGLLPDTPAGIRSVHLATNGTVICAAVAMQNGDSIVHVFNPTTNQTLVISTLPLASSTVAQARVVFDGTNFWVVGINASNNIVGFKFNPATDTQFPAPTSLAVIGSAISDIAISTCGASDFVIAFANSTDVFARRYNTLGVQQAAWTATTDDALAVGISANTAGTLISVGWQRVTGNTYAFSTFNAAGVLQTGPTALFGGSSGSIARLGMRQQGAVICFVGAANVDFLFGSIAPEFETVTQLCTNQATHALNTTTAYRDSVPSTLPFFMANGANNEFYFGVVDYFAGANSQGTNELVERETRLPHVFKDATLAMPILFDNVNSVNGTVTIGTKAYWACLRRTFDNLLTFSVTEMEMGDPQRRQMAQVANELQISGGMGMTYGGRCLCESGFAERPQIVSLTGGGSGSKTLLGVYRVRVTWEVIDERDNIMRSQASDFTEITLTGAQNSIQLLCTAPHSLRTSPLLQLSGSYSVRVVAYVTTSNGGNFFQEAVFRIDPNTVQGHGSPVSIFLGNSDALLQENAVLYEQSQTPVPHVSPPPYQYSWTARERQIIGGLPLEEQWLFSKLLFPSEPVEFANLGRLGFSGRANQQVTAMGAFETVGLVWTKSEVAIIPGRGPEHNGTGEFDTSIRVPSPGGCIDWRSVVDAPPGFFFQMASDKLMLVPRSAQSAGGAGAVTWIGQPVRQTLALFPVITGAVHVRSQMIVAFSITNVAGSDGRILIYDLRREQWYVDTVGPAIAVSELDGRLAYVVSNAVFLQDVAPGTGTFPTCLVQTGMQPVTKRLGWGHLYKVGLLGLDSGACSVECFIDYDDGVGYRSLGIEAFTGTGLAVQRFWSLAIQKAARFSIRFVVTGSSGTLGLRLNAWALEVEGSKNMVRVGSVANVA